jgi:hypothetical protein
MWRLLRKQLFQPPLVLYLLKSSFDAIWSPPARRQLIMSYKTGPTVVTLPTWLASSYIFPRTLGPLTVICACPSTQATPPRVVPGFDFLRSWERRFFRSEGGLPLSVAVNPGLSGLVSPQVEMSLAFEVASFWTNIAWTATDLVQTPTWPCSSGPPVTGAMSCTPISSCCSSGGRRFDPMLGVASIA